MDRGDGQAKDFRPLDLQCFDTVGWVTGHSAHKYLSYQPSCPSAVLLAIIIYSSIDFPLLNSYHWFASGRVSILKNISTNSELQRLVLRDRNHPGVSSWFMAGFRNVQGACKFRVLRSETQFFTHRKA